MREACPERAGKVVPFELEAGKPAIPASSLRGLISSIVEAASNSALRVLEDKSYSFRRSMKDRTDILSAIGMVIVDGSTGDYRLRPLTLPTIEIRRQGDPAVLPDSYRGLFPVPNLKVYVGNWVWLLWNDGPSGVEAALVLLDVEFPVAIKIP